MTQPQDSVQLRLAAFRYLDDLRMRGPYVYRADLEAFTFNGHRLPLIANARGIHKPEGWSTVLSILSTDRPADAGGYDDVERPDGTLLYRFMTNKGDRLNAYNQSLVTAFETGVPLLYLERLAPKLFEPLYPVWIRGVETDGVIVSYETPDSEIGEITDLAAEMPDLRRYTVVKRRHRVHQDVFRSRVLHAYGDRCCMCSLKRRQLLDAAHIIDDAEPNGHAIVQNGLALCRIHHGAYDNFLIGVRPDLRIEVAKDVLEEIDGPMLKHGLQSIHGQTIRVPDRHNVRPTRDRLDWKFQRFLDASRE